MTQEVSCKFKIGDLSLIEIKCDLNRLTSFKSRVPIKEPKKKIRTTTKKSHESFISSTKKKSQIPPLFHKFHTEVTANFQAVFVSFSLSWSIFPSLNLIQCRYLKVPFDAWQMSYKHPFWSAWQPDIIDSIPKEGEIHKNFRTELCVYLLRNSQHRHSR